MKDNGSGVNTILLVLILVLVVAGLVWFVQNAAQSPAQEDDSANINVQFPVGSDENSEQ